MITIIYISLALAALLILEDYVFSATLKMNTPPTSAQLYLESEEYDPLDDVIVSLWENNYSWEQIAVAVGLPLDELLAHPTAQDLFYK